MIISLKSSASLFTSDRLASRNPCTRRPCGRTTHARVGNEIGSNVLCKDFVNPALGLGLLESWGLTACGYAAVAQNGGSRLRRGRPLLLHLRSCATFESRPLSLRLRACRCVCLARELQTVSFRRFRCCSQESTLRWTREAEVLGPKGM
jgi:hypothetical protein